MVFKSINPKNGRIMKTVDCITTQRLHEECERSFKVYKYMKNQGLQGVEDRAEKFNQVKTLLNERKASLAEIITNEVGKPLRESVGEIDKSISMIDYFNKNTENFLKDETLLTHYPNTLVVNQPWGPTLSKFERLRVYRYFAVELPDMASVQDRPAGADGG